MRFSRKIILQQPVQFFFAVYVNTVFQRTLVCFGQIFRPVGKDPYGRTIPILPQSNISVPDSQKKTE